VRSLELKTKRDGLEAELDALANKPETLTAEEKTRWSQLRTEIKGLNNDIQIEEEREEVLRHSAAQNGRTISKKDEKDIRAYSFVRALQGVISGKGLTGLELEMHQEAEREAARTSGIGTIAGIGIPSMVHSMKQRADITTATAPLVPTNIVGFIDALYAKLFAVQAGAMVMTGLTGNVSIPRVATRASSGWATEVADASDAGSDTESVSLTPKRLTTYQDISRQLIMQSPMNVEQMIRNLFISGMYVDLETAVIAGATNGPTGLLSTSNIGNLAGGDNGAAPTLAHMLALIKTIAAADAEFGSLGFAVSPAGRWKLQSTAIETGHPQRVWAPDVPDMLLGYKAYVSSVIPDDLTKGNQSEVCSAIIFGNWAEMIIAQFGPLDITVDNLTQAIGNKTRVVLNSFWDSAVKHPASFAAMKDAKCAE
jgi:HK97 family phage major capsid protein